MKGKNQIGLLSISPAGVMQAGAAPGVNPAVTDSGATIILQPEPAQVNTQTITPDTAPATLIDTTLQPSNNPPGQAINILTDTAPLNTSGPAVNLLTNNPALSLNTTPSVPFSFSFGSVTDWIKNNPGLSIGAAVLIYYLFFHKKTS